ncbi:hypothetical protein A8990_17117 [Paenibacillus taihuensis]|uniref:Uncharacterized protein n=1 Tax=Paenibacillus taihuensis TaxID=1156355 RepID=A0A3D9Q620_9BACL|nr:hypothetical protein A8990_17117 [Paenibacillus taihuensis]
MDHRWIRISFSLAAAILYLVPVLQRKQFKKEMAELRASGQLSRHLKEKWLRRLQLHIVLIIAATLCALAVVIFK